MLNNSLEKLGRLCYYIPCRRDVAQFGRALRSGRKGRRFESCHPDQTNVDRGTARIAFLGLFVLLLYNSYPPGRCLRSVRPPICFMLLRRRALTGSSAHHWRGAVLRARFINFYLSGPDFGFVFSKILNLAQTSALVNTYSVYLFNYYKHSCNCIP